MTLWLIHFYWIHPEMELLSMLLMYLKLNVYMGTLGDLSREMHWLLLAMGQRL